MTYSPYEVTIIEASVNEWGHRLVTLVARYPRFIHSELMTHKDLSRNASSSRAVPFKKMLKIARNGMAAPIFWGKNQPGMSADNELKGFKLWAAKFMWHLTGHVVLSLAWLMSFTQVHKQIINRMIEPWTYINVQITATNWQRMLDLRLHRAAQPEFQALAQAIETALDEATYKPLNQGDWHLPWVTDVEKIQYPLRKQKEISAARSARLSYTPMGAVKANATKDLQLARGLLEELHLSPFEHQATPMKGRSANFLGWTNFRTELRH